MAMKEHIRYKADTTPLRSSPQDKVFVSRFLAVILKLMLKITSIFPRDRGESLRRRRRRRRRRRSAFIYYTFIHTHTVTYFINYHKAGDQASIEVEEVEEQMLILSSS